MPISFGVCKFQPGSVKIGGTWQLAHLALVLKIVYPRVAASRLKLSGGGFGTGIAN
jgi:hypothetical protein